MKQTLQNNIIGDAFKQIGEYFANQKECVICLAPVNTAAKIDGDYYCDDHKSGANLESWPQAVVKRGLSIGWQGMDEYRKWCERSDERNR